MAKSLLERLKQRFIGWLIEDHLPHEYPECDFERLKQEIQICDVMLVEGRSRVSEVIRVVTQSPWSHAALYIGKFEEIQNPILQETVRKHFKGKIEGEPLIIESLLGKGTIISSLNNYEKDHVRLCRPKGLAKEDTPEIVSFAIGCLGFQYDVRQIFDLARYLFPWSILPRRWRSSLFRYNTGDATRIICSTLIAEAFATVNYPVLPSVKKNAKGLQFIRRNPRLITPSVFDYSPYFEILKYPRYSLTIDNAYKHLNQPLAAEDAETEVKVDERDVKNVIHIRKQNLP